MGDRTAVLQAQIEVLQHTIANRSREVIAGAVGWSTVEVGRFLAEQRRVHGNDKAALAALQQQQRPGGSRAPSPPSRSTVPAIPTSATIQQHRPDVAMGLLARADRLARDTGSKRLASAAQKLRDQIAALDTAVTEAEARAREDAATRAERERARERIQQLEAELAKQKAVLNGRPEGDPTAAEIRAWARENGVECRQRGPVPPDVRAAYYAAQQQSSTEEASA